MQSIVFVFLITGLLITITVIIFLRNHFIRVMKRLKIKKLLRTCFEESSIHGFPHIVHPGRHFIERLFWLAVICLSMCMTIGVCSDQYTRYLQNPTVLSMETNYRNWEYRPAALTICSNYTNTDIAIKMVKRYWNIEPGMPDFQYYLDYVITVSTARYDNFALFEPFINDTTLETVEMLNIIREMKESIPLPNKYFTTVITELGFCQTSSKLFRFQNPYRTDGHKNAPEESKPTCRSLDVCKFSTTPSDLDAESLTIYIHNENDVLTADDTISVILDGSIVLEVIVELNEVVAAKSALLRLPPKIRKCLFSSESQSPYFDVYTINLCKTTCRIQVALELCGCVPFIYSVDVHPICTPKGLFCLSKTNFWRNANKTCECPELCEYQKLKKKFAEPRTFYKFSKMMSLYIVFPKNRIKRNVLFSFNDLIVSFGGAAALFLGFSFLSGVELIFFLVEYLCKLIWPVLA